MSIIRALRYSTHAYFNVFFFSLTCFYTHLIPLLYTHYITKAIILICFFLVFLLGPLGRYTLYYSYHCVVAVVDL